MKTSKIIVNIVSLGCAKNLVDTEVMCGSLVSSGMYLSEDPEDANVCLINTCSFIRDARRESEDAIKDAIAWKNTAPAQTKRIIAVAGCLAQRYPDETKAKFPDIDLLLGLDDVPNAAELIKAAFSAKGTQHEVSRALPTYLYDHRTPRLTVTPHSYSYLKIAEGCDHQCAFCAIPLFRGKQRSRSIDSVVAECRQLLDIGSKEINFVAQDTSRYGLDRDDGATLAKLLRECDKLDGDYWIRVLYTHPAHTSTELLDTLAGSKHVVPYLDMPIQHISTDVLKAMLRGSTGPQLREKLHAIRRDYPSLTFRTTVLVGFPGETDKDFQELLDFINEFKFDRLGAFAYSPEAGTPAEKLSLPIPPHKIAVQRKNALLKAQGAISLAANKKLVGTEMEVLMEEQIDAGLWLARSKGDAPDVDQRIMVKEPAGARGSEDDDTPRFARVKITKGLQYDLKAEAIVTKPMN